MISPSIAAVEPEIKASIMLEMVLTASDAPIAAAPPPPAPPAPAKAAPPALAMMRELSVAIRLRIPAPDVVTLLPDVI